MPALDRIDRNNVVNTLPKDFLDRYATTVPSAIEIEDARRVYGGLPQDVLEEIARQQSAARPIIERYHLLAEIAPSIAVARATIQDDIENLLDVVIGMDLTDLSDEGEFDDEYTCPKCAHAWSGAPNYRTGYKGKVFVPRGTISYKTGRLQSQSYNATPDRSKGSNFEKGRNWRGASAESLPRGFGNKPIGEPIVDGNWKKRKRKYVYAEG